MTPNAHAAFGCGMDYRTFKSMLGGYDLLGAALLWREKTRRVGFVAPIVGFAWAVVWAVVLGWRPRGGFGGFVRVGCVWANTRAVTSFDVSVRSNLVKCNLYLKHKCW